MAAYYNENEPFCVQWLRNLISAGHIAPGDVDDRSIVDVQADDLREYEQCHFFAGIGGWAIAALTVGRVWTGSCPCQPHSSASRGRKVGIDLWPEWFRLIAECRPAAIFGEQVDEARAWLDDVRSDLEAVGYTFRARVLPAYSVGADHVRERIYFAGHANSNSEPGRSVNGKTSWMPRARGVAPGMVPKNGISARVALLRAFGNAIHPDVAAEFIAAVMECKP